jgi:hypothetical protein
MHVFAGLFVLCVVLIFLPGLMYMLVTIWEMISCAYGDDDEDIECTYELRGSFNADNFDEYVVRYRPDLLSFDIMTAQEAEKEVLLNSAYELDTWGEQSEASTKSLLAVDPLANYGTLNV